MITDDHRIGYHTKMLLPLILAAASAIAVARAGDLPTQDKIKLVRVPNEGIQPQVALDDRGTMHLIYYKGDAKGGDVFYVTSKDGGSTFSAPLRVNNVPESAVAAGTIRGAQLAIGRNGQVHVAWNGSTK